MIATTNCSAVVKLRIIDALVFLSSYYSLSFLVLYAVRRRPSHLQDKWRAGSHAPVSRQCCGGVGKINVFRYK